MKAKCENHLYYGDNLTIMQRMPKHCVDLIYLDPPFNSKQNYNLIYKNMTGLPVPDQAEAFCDTWEMDPEKEEIAKTMPILMREYGIENYYVEFWRLWIQALRHTQPHLLAYLIYMVQRLLHMKTLLRPTGSIWLHCDSTASHYIKVMMDGIFGHKHFQNEVIWKRADTVKGNAGQGAKGFGRNTDTLLFYSATDAFTFHPQFTEYSGEYLAKSYKYKEPDGRRYRLISMIGPGGAAKGNPYYEVMGVSRCWRYSKKRMQELIDQGMVVQTKPGTVPSRKQYLDQGKGVPVQSLWDDISALGAGSGERLGYPTQKPVALVRRIIEACSNPGDVVFDPFCGCGTSIYAAQQTNRRWIGCDIAILSIKLVREILTGEKYRLVEGVHFDVDGIPVSVEQAQELFKRDPFQFEHWIVERVGGFPTKKTGDQGIDGRMYFQTQHGLKAMVLSVKGGKLRPTDVRDLVGVLEHEPETEMAGFLSLQEPTKAMRDAGAKAGQYIYEGVKYDRVQFLTVKDILEDKREFRTPTKLRSRVSSPQASLALT
ncbi:MAG: site-specific DNA-methyltransferase [Alphaproteobacteria bacterium]|nr:site-specific DNA-methyltransferase [Alphaproteobacteria bacterium]